MKRKEAIKFLDSVAEYISGVDGTITLFNPKSNESVELDTDLAFCFMGTPHRSHERHARERQARRYDTRHVCPSDDQIGVQCICAAAYKALSSWRSIFLVSSRCQRPGNASSSFIYSSTAKSPRARVAFAERPSGLTAARLASAFGTAGTSRGQAMD